MTKKIALNLLILVLSLAFSVNSFAQIPTPIKAKIMDFQGNPEACVDQFAGNTSFTNFIGQSNDIWGGMQPDTIYLCMGDQFDISISGQDLTGDPNASTPPGVGFGFYNCPPSIVGPDLVTVNADCHYTNLAGEFLIATGGSTSGNQTFENTGLLQGQFAGGNPVCVWYAPITYDELTGTSPTYENSGPCVNVNINDRFPVVYLNAIQASNIQNSVGSFDCQGSFTALGGLPQYNGGTYTIDVSLAADPSVKAIILNNTPSHGDQVRFQIGQTGLYNITISDGKSCSVTETVDMVTCPTVTLDIADVSSPPGTNVCVPVTVENFTNITSMEFILNWDPAIVNFDQISSTLLPGILVNSIGAGQITFVWVSPTFPNGISINDGDVAFNICFDLTGPLGSTSPVWIGPNTNGIVFSDDGGTQNGLDYSSMEGSVTIQTPSTINVNLVATAPVCAGQATGSIDVTVDASADFPIALTYTHSTLGAPTGTINIPNGTQVNIANFIAGVYNLHLVDNSGAVLDTTIEVLAGFQLGANLPAVTTQCFGELMSICPDVFDSNLNPVTDFTGYTFLWSGGGNAMCQDAIPSGFFAVTVTDPNGCDASASGTLIQPSQIQLNPVITHPSCKGVFDGQVFLQPTGGEAPTGYTFQWESNPPSKAPSLTVAGLDEGTYNVTVTDDNMCEVEASFTLVYVIVIEASAIKQDITCNGNNDGSILASGSTTGGAAALPYTYTWNPIGVFGNNPMGLSAGLYELTITDTNGCLDSTNVVIQEPSPMSITMNSIQHESCTTGADGMISIAATGGGGGYTYSWNTVPVQATIIATGLSAGNYTIAVLDANNCTETETYTINPPTPPTIDNFTKVDVSCPTDNNGGLAVNVSAGNGQTFSYSWDTGETTSSIANLGEGEVCVTVSDEYGCQVNACDTIVATDAFSIVMDTFILPTCVGDANGSLIVQMAGSGNFQFLEDTWNAGSGNTFILPGIAAGTYDVTITDLLSTCPDIETSFVLPEPHAILTSITLQNGVSCFNGSHLDGAATASASYSDGAAGTFNFTWGPNITQCLGAVSCASTNLGINQNWVTIDDGQCTVTDTILVGGPDSILITNLTVTPASCYKDNDGAISIQVQGGNPGYSYGWTGPAASQPSADVTNLPAGNYTVSITDMVGCGETFDFVVDEPDSLQLLIDLTKTVNVYCFGESTGKIFVQPIGGNEGYTYAWTPDISDTNVASSLEAGNYTVTVTDIKGCTQSLIYELTENPPIVATLNPIEDPECFGYQTVISVDTVIGGAGGPYTYSVDYSPPQSIELDYQVFADSHFVLIYDAFECLTEIRVNINEPDEIYLNLPETLEVELGDSVQLNPVISSSLPIDSFFWTPILNLNPSNVLHPFVVDLYEDQVYELTIFDENGCSQVAEVLVEVDRNRNVYIPNIFSPNNDGFNDIFHPKTGIGVKEVVFMNIYDRWGNIVFGAKNFLPGDNSPAYWDGTYHDKIMDPGVFVYVIEIEFLDGKKLLYRGDVTLMR